MPTLLYRALICLIFLSASPAGAFASGHDGNIFQRYAAGNNLTRSQQILVEVPTALRPQTDPDAEIRENLGVNYVYSEWPAKKSYGSLGFSLARSKWNPSDPNLQVAEISQMDIFASINIRTFSWLYINWGFGLGLLDGIVTRTDGTFSHALVPYIPFHLGAVAPVTSFLSFSYRTVYTPFIGDGPVVGTARTWLGIGYNY